MPSYLYQNKKKCNNFLLQKPSSQKKIKNVFTQITEKICTTVQAKKNTLKILIIKMYFCTNRFVQNCTEAKKFVQTKSLQIFVEKKYFCRKFVDSNYLTIYYLLYFVQLYNYFP